jgi:hypothetical protein
MKNVTGILEFCRDESLGSEQTTISVMELQESIKNSTKPLITFENRSGYSWSSRKSITNGFF